MKKGFAFLVLVGLLLVGVTICSPTSTNVAYDGGLPPSSIAKIDA